MDTKQVIVVRTDLQMRKGKLAAQVSHASMMFILVKSRWESNEAYESFEFIMSPEQRNWFNGSFAKVVVGIDSEESLKGLIEKGKAAGLTVHSIIDEGRTEFGGVPTLTCAAFGPHDNSKLDPITGHLKLL